MKHLKKLYPILILLTLAALLLAACGSATPAPEGRWPTLTAEAAQPTQPAQPAQGGPAPAAQAGQTPAAQPQSPPESVLQLSGRVWQWTKTTYNDGRTITVSTPANYTIEFFLADGKVAVKADCNNVSGSFTADASNLTITLGPSTMAACPPGSLDSEYIKELGEVAQYVVQGDALVLNFKADSGGMTFTAAAAAAAQPTQPSAVPGQDLGGQQWQWVKTDLKNGQTTSPSNPADYTIAFSMADGKVTIKADCNNAVGEFMTDGQNLQIMIGGVTRAMCQPGSLSDEFLKELSEVSAYQVQGNTLTFTTGSGTMTLTAGQATAQPAAPQPAAPQPAAPQPAAPTGPAASLEGTTWQWSNTTYSNGSTVTSPDPTKYTLNFNQATKRFIFVADCNNGSGVYTVNGQNLTMQVQGMTRAYCPSPSDEYIQMLDQVASYKIDGNTLSLSLKTNGTMTFMAGATRPAAGAGTPAGGAATPAAPASSSATPAASTGSNLQRLTSGVWKWQQSADSSGQTWTAPNPANYTLQFNPDGTLGVKVDCNTGGGSYQADETNLTIQLGATTLMACPPPTLENEFRQQLSQVASYFFDGDNLILLWKMDSGSMKFAQ